MAVLIYTMKLAPSLLFFFFVYKAIIYSYFNLATATSGPAALALGSSAES